MSTNPLESILQRLVSGDALPSKEDLTDLSDLSPADLELLSKIWDKIPTAQRRDLLQILGKMADEDIMLSYEVINRFALNDADHEIRCTAIRNLWESEDHRLIPIFISALTNDSSPDVRAAAAKALGPFVLLGENRRVPGDLRKDVEDALVNSYHAEEEEGILGNCIRSLGFSSNTIVHDLILEAYQSGEERMVQASLLAMGRSANSQYAEYVLTNLSNPSPDLRYEAVVAAGELEIQEAIPDLNDLLGDVDLRIRRAAIWSLSQIGGKQSKQILIDLLDAGLDEEEIELVEDALSNLDFVDTRELLEFGFEESQDSSF
jgi:HEAT repeat protein